MERSGAGGGGQGGDVCAGPEKVQDSCGGRNVPGILMFLNLQTFTDSLT